MTINVPLLRKVLELITAQPWTWNQETWACVNKPEQAEERAEEYGVSTKECGSAFCLAGHVAHLAGRLMKVSRFDYVTAIYAAEYVMDDGSAIGTYAERELGLTLEQADALFEAGNSLFSLWKLASEYTNGEIQIPADVERDHA